MPGRSPILPNPEKPKKNKPKSDGPKSILHCQLSLEAHQFLRAIANAKGKSVAAYLEGYLNARRERAVARIHVSE